MESAKKARLCYKRHVNQAKAEAMRTVQQFSSVFSVPPTDLSWLPPERVRQHLASLFLEHHMKKSCFTQLIQLKPSVGLAVKANLPLLPDTLLWHDGNRRSRLLPSGTKTTTSRCFAPSVTAWRWDRLP